MNYGTYQGQAATPAEPGGTIFQDNEAAHDMPLGPYGWEVRRTPRQRARDYTVACAVAIAAAAGALAWGQLFPGSGAGAPFLPFFIAVIAASWSGGTLAGAFVGTVGAVSVATATKTIAGALPAMDTSHIVAYLVGCLAIAAFGGALRRARRRVRMAHDDAMHQRGRLDAALQAVDAALIVTDPAGRVVNINAAAERLTGVPAPLALGRPLAGTCTLIDRATCSPFAAAACREMPDDLVRDLAMPSAGGAQARAFPVMPVSRRRQGAFGFVVALGAGANP